MIGASLRKQRAWYGGGTPTIVQDSFAFYNDGTESGSVIIGSVNADPTLEVDTTYLIRFLVKNTGTAALSNVDLEFQYNLNSAGWINITTTSSVVKAVDSANLTNGDPCTQRIGAGTFNGAVGVTEDGISGGTALDLALGTETETLLSFQIVAADVVDADSIQIRLTRDGGTLLNTYTITPTITVHETTIIQQANTGTITPAGAIANKALIAQTGAITPAGALLSKVLTAVSGVISPSGVLTSLLLVTKAVDGILSFAGTLGTTVFSGLTGAISPSGLLTSKISIALSGVITPAGALVSTAKIVLTGAITPVGALIVKTLKVASGVITFAGDLTWQVTGLAQHSETGAITPVGALLTKVSSALSGLVSFGGALTSKTGVSFSGAISPGGLLTSLVVIQHAETAVLSFVGQLATKVFSALTSAIAPVGALLTKVSKAASGTVAFVGVLTSQFIEGGSNPVSVAGSLSATGTLLMRLFPIERGGYNISLEDGGNVIELRSYEGHNINA
jgi:hypothetical protein